MVDVAPDIARTPPHVLHEYAILADGERGAVVGPRGDIAWLCFPRWDSDPVFDTLLGGPGGYSIAPDAPYVWGGSYVEGTLIWHSRWVTNAGIVESREALCYPGDPHRMVLLRRVQALDAAARVAVWLRPSDQWQELHRHGDTWTARVGGLYLRWTGAAQAHARDRRGALLLPLDLAAGQHHDLVLELSDRPLPDEPVDADTAWRATETAWREAVPACAAALDPRHTRHSYAVLRGLTGRGGGMVAAATTGLPERADAGRDYDYRYVWIRDQCYAGQAAATIGPDPLLDDAVRFVADRLLADRDRLAPAYTTLGEPVPDPHSLGLPGYPGGSDLAGNRVNKQFQLDSFGEALLLFATAAGYDHLDGKHWDAVRLAANAIEEHWREPDAGIWELDDNAWTHSRLIAAAGLRAVAATISQAAPSLRTEGWDWLTLADRIVADTSTHALHPDGHWQRTPDDPQVDAALLIPALRGATPADDPRALATFDAYLRELADEGYAYRFRHDPRPLSEAEGSFLLCGFLVSLTHHQHGNPVQARSWYEITRTATGPARLFSEEYDAVQQQMRGNLPQAFVHALHLETAHRLVDP
ncbi:MAG TPA: glycoside hydrolase family 15 protein [Pseudonocardiaceae bacterium]